MADKPRPGRPAKNGHRPKRPSARVNEIVSKFDEEEHNRQIENDIEHGVLHNGGTANELEEHVEDMSMLACESDGLFKDVFGQMTEDDYLVDCKTTVLSFLISSTSFVLSSLLILHI